MNRIGGDSTQLRWNLQSKPASVCELKTGFIPMPLTIGSTSFVGVAILELIRALGWGGFEGVFWSFKLDETMGDRYTVVSGARPKCWQRQCRVRQNSDAVLARLAGNGDPVRQGTSKISASWVLPCTL
uniref:Uncharacterized protein n=1 Tax=Oryza rufipogon TaxID=4529 RepID=A0A0E0PPE4_ORYRU